MVPNRTLYHNFKPLSAMLSNPDWQAYGFFNGAYSAHKVYDDGNRIECYYLMDTTHTLAIGWVHNLNAYWENHYYATSIKQNFFGCTAPPTPQQVALPGFAAGTDYHITWFPTCMNDTVHPADAVDGTGTGTVLLDLSTTLLGDTVNKYMDTLHLDYGFIISLAPVHRSMAIPQEADIAASLDWDFSLYPNPAHDLLNLVLPDNTAKDVSIYDLSGRQVYHQAHATGPVVRIPIGRFSSGSYGVRVSDAAFAHIKLLIIQ